MIAWEKESFDDLSGVWLQAEAGRYGLAVEYDGPGIRYCAWLTTPDDEQVCIRGLGSIVEARELAEDMYAQHVIDTHGAVFFDV